MREEGVHYILMVCRCVNIGDSHMYMLISELSVSVTVPTALHYGTAAYFVPS